MISRCEKNISKKDHNDRAKENKEGNYYEIK